jgi:DNA-binding transcriptional LysR family regulator
LVPLASEAYLVANGPPVALADLAKHRLIGWRIGRSNPREWPLAGGKVLAVEPSFVSSNANLVHRAAQQGFGILLGNPDPYMLPLPTPLVPVLEDQIGHEVAFRCLSPFPTDHDPRTRSVLEGIHRFLSHLPAA